MHTVFPELYLFYTSDVIKSSFLISLFDGGRVHTGKTAQRAPSSYNTAPTKLLTDANGFPSDLFQSPDLFLWAWCLFLNTRIFQRQCPGQGMTGNSWCRGWTEKSPEWGQGGEFLVATGIMSSKLLSDLIPGLILQVEILSTPTIGGSITWHKLSGQPSGSTNLARI